MEEQIAQLAARLDTLETANATANSVIAEMYYYITLPLLLIALVGFLLHEMGASRVKNLLSSAVKNVLAIAFVIPAFYFFGWFIYWAFPTGYQPSADNWQTAVDFANPIGAVMGPNLGDKHTGVLWGVFALVAALVAAIFSGAVIERIRVSSFLFLAIMLGAVCSALGASWGWHVGGWLVTEWGYHDFGAAGVVHIVAGFFALGVLINLGPRIGKFNSDGSANSIDGHNAPYSIAGLLLVVVGLFGFFMACMTFPGFIPSTSAGTSWASIYGTPTTLSSVAFNMLMGLCGGVIGAWLISRDPQSMLSGALAGIIACAAGLDVYWPPMAFCIGFVGGVIVRPFSNLLEAMGIDDAVGAVSVHGIVGFWSVLAMGIFAAGYPALPGENYLLTTLTGQVVGAASMAALGFLPGFLLSLLLRWLGILRVGRQAELLGLDPAKIPRSAYPEGIPVSPVPIRH